jgi:hypothetical protein
MKPAVLMKLWLVEDVEKQTDEVINVPETR